MKRVHPGEDRRTRPLGIKETCPFCDSHAELYTRKAKRLELEAGYPQRVYGVQCTHPLCGAEIDGCESKEQAAARWAKREEENDRRPQGNVSGESRETAS